MNALSLSKSTPRNSQGNKLCARLIASTTRLHRPSITHAIAGLEGAGLVERGRQQITILDRQGLIEASCECYRLVRERVAFHLPRTYP